MMCVIAALCCKAPRMEGGRARQPAESPSHVPCLLALLLEISNVQQHRRRTHSMSTSASLNRLATSSRCLSIAKNPLLAAQPGIQCPHHRSYATEHASPRPPHAKQAPVPPSLAARLHKSVKHKERARVPLPKLKVPYPAMAVNVSPPGRNPHLAVKKHPSHPSNAPQKGKGPSKPSKKIALDEGPAMWRAAAQKDRVTVVQPTWRQPKVKVLPRAENTVPERSAPRRPTGPEGAKLVPAAEYAQKVAWKGKELELGPGFVQEAWADQLSVCLC